MVTHSSLINWAKYILHCWKILLILVLGKVVSKTQYSHFVICKVWVLGFTHHFTLHPLIWQIFSLISWLYFSTMWILWGRKCDYWVFHITHAKKGLPNHSSSTCDLKDFFSICDVENTILAYPPHSILSLQRKSSTRQSSKRQFLKWFIEESWKRVIRGHLVKNCHEREYYQRLESHHREESPNIKK